MRVTTPFVSMDTHTPTQDSPQSQRLSKHSVKNVYKLSQLKKLTTHSADNVNKFEN